MQCWQQNIKSATLQKLTDKILLFSDSMCWPLLLIVLSCFVLYNRYRSLKLTIFWNLWCQQNRYRNQIHNSQWNNFYLSNNINESKYKLRIVFVYLLFFTPLLIILLLNRGQNYKLYKTRFFFLERGPAGPDGPAPLGPNPSIAFGLSGPKNDWLVKRCGLSSPQSVLYTFILYHLALSVVIVH